MSRDTNRLLHDLSWTQVEIELERLGEPASRGEHLLLTLNHVFKMVPQPPPKGFVYRLPSLGCEVSRPVAGRRYRVWLTFTGAGPDAVSAWLDRLQAHLGDGAARRYFLTRRGEPGVRRLEQLDLTPPEGREVCLDFLSPLRLDGLDPAQPRYIPLSAFLELLRARVARGFGVNPLRIETPDLTLVSAYMREQQGVEKAAWIHQASGGGKQWLFGLLGKLYLKGNIAPLWPWLRLAEEIQLPAHANQRMLGHFVLHPTSLPHFAGRFPEPAGLARAARAALERYDDLQEEVAALALPFDPDGYGRALADELAQGRYEPAPAEAFYLPRPHGGRRLVERFCLRDRVVHQYVYELLAEVFDHQFHPAAIGYRKGHSWRAAGERIQALAREGYRYILEADIEDFFPSVDLDILWSRLDACLPLRDQVLRHTLRKLLHVGYRLNGRHYPRRHGLPQGSALSPLLSNLHLDAFDRAVTGQGGQLIRYADDFVVLTRERAEAERLLDVATRQLASLGLRLKADKTGIRPLREGFVFLGQQYGPEVDNEAPPLEPLRKPLYISEPYLYLAVNGAALDIRRQGRTIETLPLRRLSEIVVLGKAVFATSLVRRCRQEGVALVLAKEDAHGSVTLATPSRQRLDTLYRHAARYHAMSAGERLLVAKRLVEARIRSYYVPLRNSYQTGTEALIRRLEADIAAAHGAADTEALRGHEGAAARRLFAALEERLLVPGFRADKRDRRAGDPLNSLLNFASHLLHARLSAQLHAAGLNPYLGFLHDGDNDYESLAYDLHELFRAHTDRLVLTVINRRIVGIGDFQPDGQGRSRLSGAARQRFVDAFERMMRASQGARSPQQAVMYQVHALRHWLCGGGEPWFYVWGGAMPGDALGQGPTD